MNPYPPVLAVPFWPTAPVVPAPKFVTVPGNTRFVPEYHWGDFEPYGAPENARRRWRKRAAKLKAQAAQLQAKGGARNAKRAKRKLALAAKLEAKAVTPGSMGSKTVPGKKPSKLQKAAKQARAAVKAQAAALLEPDDDADDAEAVEELAEADVPATGPEGSSNMTLMIGGTVAVLALAGIAFYVQNKKAKAKARQATRPEANDTDVSDASLPSSA